MGGLDVFFELGNKATNNNPVRKALFDYCLYWVVFMAFIGIAITYFYNFFFNNSSISTLFWGIVVSIFSWFNYWALASFRLVYLNMKKAEVSLSNPLKFKIEDSKEMLDGFSNGS